jgi:hypothetical protein
MEIALKVYKWIYVAILFHKPHLGIINCSDTNQHMKDLIHLIWKIKSYLRII